MEIRKFIIELHPDGKMTWCEYQEPNTCDFIAGKRFGINQVIGLIAKEVDNMRTMALSDESSTHGTSYHLYAGAYHILSHCYEHLNNL